MIRFPCGTCGRRLRVPARLAGKRGRCERCGAINRVPLADVMPPDEQHAPEATAEGDHIEPAVAVAPPPPPPPPPPTPPPPPPPPPPQKEEVRETPSPLPPPKPDVARSFSREAVPEEQSAAVEVTPSAFGIDEASVFPPVGDFEKVEEIDFSHAPAEPPAATPDESVDAAAEQQPASDKDAPSVPNETPPAPEPEVVPVDVRRAPASPFRSTADLRPRQMIEGTVEVPSAQFAASTLPATISAGSGGAASTFLDLVAQRVGVIQQPAPASVTEAPPRAFPPAAIDDEPDEEPVIRILHIDVDEDDAPRAPARETRARPPVGRPPPQAVRPALPAPPPPPPPPVSIRRVVVLSLLVGVIIGFVLGLIVADLL